MIVYVEGFVKSALIVSLHQRRKDIDNRALGKAIDIATCLNAESVVGSDMNLAIE